MGGTNAEGKAVWAFFRRLDDGSRMSREVHVRFCEQRRGKFPPLTLRSIYVRTKRSGERVMDSVIRYVEKVLKLKVNRKKSAVARPWKRIFLGFTFLKVHGVMRIHIPEVSWKRFRSRVKELLHLGRGWNVVRFVREVLNPMLRGWLQYVRLGASKRLLRQHDFWIRRRLRCLLWRQWKRPATRIRKLRSLGCADQRAWAGCTRRGPWWCAGMPAAKQAMDPEYFRRLDVFNLLDNMAPHASTSSKEPPWYGSVRPVV